MAYSKLFPTIFLLFSISVKGQNLTNPIGYFKAVPDTIKMRFVVIPEKDSLNVIVVYGYVLSKGSVKYVNKDWVTIQQTILFKEEFDWF
jgi:hypothetical protein